MTVFPLTVKKSTKRPGWLLMSENQIGHFVVVDQIWPWLLPQYCYAHIWSMKSSNNPPPFCLPFSCQGECPDDSWMDGENGSWLLGSQLAWCPNTRNILTYKKKVLFSRWFPFFQKLDSYIRCRSNFIYCNKLYIIQNKGKLNVKKYNV